jgi:hypothetical protein
LADGFFLIKNEQGALLQVLQLAAANRPAQGQQR